MSGPIVPPLEVTEVDGSPDGRPITKIIVSNGDLTISGRTATIDTSGSGGAPGAPAKSVQFNSGNPRYERTRTENRFERCDGKCY